MSDVDYQVIKRSISSQLPTQYSSSAQAIFTTETEIIIGTKDGSLLFYNLSLDLLRTKPKAIEGSIDTIEKLDNHTILITHDTYLLSLYDITKDEILERLPFKDITAANVLSNGTENTFAISTKNLVLVYEWNGDYKSLELVRQYRSDENILFFKFTTLSSLLVIATSSNFYYINIDSVQTQDKFQKLTFNSFRYSFFNQLPYIYEISQDQLLISKGSKCQVVSTRGASLHKLCEFSWNTTPKSLQNLSPFHLACTADEIHIKDYVSLVNKHQGTEKDLQILNIPNLQTLSVSKNYQIIVVLTYAGELTKYERSPMEVMIKRIADWDLEKGISILEQYHQNDQDDNASKRFHLLRDLQIRKAIKLFQTKRDYSKAIETFMKYIACPMTVIELYPDLTTLINQELTNDRKNTLNLLAQYLTDSRRKLTRLLSSLAAKETIQYKEGKIELSYFTSEGKYAISEIQRQIDTALFLTYCLINPGLIGSLVRLDNQCSPEVIINVLKAKEMNRELVDYYFKQGNHEEALRLVYPTTAADPVELIRYLQRLKNNDHLDLILKYVRLLVRLDVKYAVKVLINSPYADSFKRITVWEFLESLDSSEDGVLDLKKSYLEFIVLELKEPSQYFAGLLIDVYWLFWEKTDFNDDSKDFEKLNEFLKVGNIELKLILSKYFKNSEKNNKPNELLLKIIVLKRLQRYDNVLKILVQKLEDYDSAIKLIIQLYADNNKDSEKILLLLMELLIEAEKKYIIIKALSMISNTISLKLPLLTILQLFNGKARFQIQEISLILLKYLKNNNNSVAKTNLSKNLLTVEVVKTEYLKLLQESKYFQVVNNATECIVCHLDINNNTMLTYLPEEKSAAAELIHLGCQQNLQEKKFKKLKIQRLKDYR